MKNVLKSLYILGFFAVAYFIMHEAVLAQDAAIAAASAIPAAAAAIDAGSTAWMLVSTLLVLMMTIPGLALFYGGMVHKESVLATLMQSFVTTTLVTVLWMVYGYSMIFTDHSSFIGSSSKFMLEGVTKDSVTGVIPESVFVMFQMTFGI